MQVLVQKFGGTSLHTKENRSHVIQHIQSGLEEHDKLVVVVSALGRKPSPYATDSLLSLINFPEQYATTREMDLLMACGETIGSIVLSNELKQHHIASVALTGAQAGIVTDDDFTRANIQHVKTKNVTEQFEHHDVVIVAGFQGQTDSGETTTIGRGGSDTTAAALGVALKSSRIEIFTDVYGIMTADPKLVKSARLLDHVTYPEVCHFVYQGAKVVHPKAIEIAMQLEIPICVRSTYAKNKGTLVSSSAKLNEQNFATLNRYVTGIVHTEDITQIQIDLDKEAGQLQSEVFIAMANADISVDFINISPSELIYTVPAKDAEKAVKALISLGFQPTVKDHCAKISAIGAGMWGVPGIASKIVEAITDQGIDILQSADSDTTFWILIDDKHLINAVNILHDVFHLEEKTLSNQEVN